MTSLELVHQHVRGQKVDHLPCQPMLMMFAARHIGVKYIDYTRDGRIMARAQVQTATAYGIDVLLTCSDPAREVIDIAGEGSVDWFDDQGPAINETRAALTDKSLLRSFRLPSMAPGGRMHDRILAIETMRREVGQQLSIVGWVEGPLALAAPLRGINTLKMDFIEDESFACDLLDFCAEVAIAYAPPQIAAGADTIGMSDAAASMIGPDLYQRLLFPRQQRVYRAIKERYPQVLTRSHMCGNTDVLAPTMNQLQADIFEIDFPANLQTIRAHLPGQVLSGNVSTITDMIQGTPDSVYRAAQRCHQICGSRHIVNCGCEVSPITPPANLKALIRYARENAP